MKKIVPIVIFITVFGALSSGFRSAEAQAWIGSVIIRSDGSVDPTTSPIQRVGDVYSLTESFIGAIVVQRDNIVIDGKSFEIVFFGPYNDQNMIDLSYRINVTVKNIGIEGDFGCGILLDNSASITLAGNHLSCSTIGQVAIRIEDSSNNSILGNTIGGKAFQGILLDHASHNIFRNNSIECLYQDFGFDMPPEDDLSCWVNDIDTSNVVHGKPIYYWVNKQNAGVPIEAGFVALVNCSNMLVQDLVLTNNEQGLLLAFTTNSTIKRNNITNNEYGIYLCACSGNTVSGNDIKSNYYGVILDGEKNAIIRNNITCFGNSDGILLWGSMNRVADNEIRKGGTGIEIGKGCTENTISGNNIREFWFGINFLEPSDNITVSNNVVASSQYGLRVHGRGNVIWNNNITKNNCGIWLVEDSSNNKFCGNDFIYNTQQVQFADEFGDQISPGDVNNWDSGYPSGGNYWSDYGGSDQFRGPYQNETGSDGIGDTPYTIDANNKDHYPVSKAMPLVKSIVINRYDTDRLTSFLQYLLFEIKYPIDCIIDLNISDWSDTERCSNIKRVYLDVSGLSPSTIELLKISEGHYRTEIIPDESPSAEDLRDATYMTFEHLFDKILEKAGPGIGGLAPAPWSYSEPPDYVVTVDELVIEYQDGTEYRKAHPILLERLPTYKDVLESMLPLWGRKDMPIGTAIIAMCPVDILVTDPVGRRVGTVYQNGQFLGEAHEIPGSFYSGKGFTPEVIYLPFQAGQYSVQVIGCDDGPYVVDIMSQGARGSTLIPVLTEFWGNATKSIIDNHAILVVSELQFSILLPVLITITMLIAILGKKKPRV